MDTRVDIIVLEPIIVELLTVLVLYIMFVNIFISISLIILGNYPFPILIVVFISED